MKSRNIMKLEEIANVIENSSYNIGLIIRQEQSDVYLAEKLIKIRKQLTKTNRDIELLVVESI